MAVLVVVALVLTVGMIVAVSVTVGMALPVPVRMFMLLFMLVVVFVPMGVCVPMAVAVVMGVVMGVGVVVGVIVPMVMTVIVFMVMTVAVAVVMPMLMPVGAAPFRRVKDAIEVVDRKPVCSGQRTDVDPDPARRRFDRAGRDAVTDQGHPLDGIGVQDLAGKRLGRGRRRGRAHGLCTPHRDGADPGPPGWGADLVRAAVAASKSVVDRSGPAGPQRSDGDA